MKYYKYNVKKLIRSHCERNNIPIPRKILEHCNNNPNLMEIDSAINLCTEWLIGFHNARIKRIRNKHVLLVPDEKEHQEVMALHDSLVALKELGLTTVNISFGAYQLKSINGLTTWSGIGDIQNE